MATSDFGQRIAESIASWRLPAERKQKAGDTVEQQRRQKRIFDAAFSALSLAAASPVMLLVAAAIKLDSRGPVLHRSRRWGKAGRVFECIKFRTMSSDGELTRAGRILRRFALDELPQLVNVLRGDMSLVGPRPLLASEAAEHPISHLRRFDTLPGMTGLWPMQGWGYAAARGYVSPDEDYARNWSIWLDVEILLRTIQAVVSGRFS